MGTDPEQ